MQQSPREDARDAGRDSTILKRGMTLVQRKSCCSARRFLAASGARCYPKSRIAGEKLLSQHPRTKPIGEFIFCARRPARCEPRAELSLDIAAH
jgi:hypothetical protein